jgi:hypothetical protein
MAEKTTTGAILIKEGTLLPEGLQLKSEPYLKVSFYSPVGALRNGIKPNWLPPDTEARGTRGRKLCRNEMVTSRGLAGYENRS